MRGRDRERGHANQLSSIPLRLRGFFSPSIDTTTAMICRSIGKQGGRREESAEKSALFDDIFFLGKPAYSAMANKFYYSAQKKELLLLLKIKKKLVSLWWWWWGEFPVVITLNKYLHTHSPLPPSPAPVCYAHGGGGESPSSPSCRSQEGRPIKQRNKYDTSSHKQSKKKKIPRQGQRAIQVVNLKLLSARRFPIKKLSPLPPPPLIGFRVT